MAKLAGKLALITGGTTGIGAATARLFRDEGAKVIVTGSRSETVDEARRALTGVEAHVSDQADTAAIERLMEHVHHNYGKIDVLFVNAGLAVPNLIDHVNEEDFDRLFSVNVRGAYFTVKHAVPIMLDDAAIIFTSSINGSTGYAGTSLYSATKAALRSFGRTLASELAPRGIRVNTISPGPVDTPILEKTGLPKEQVEEYLQSMLTQMPLARVGRSEEVAAAALYLAADATFTTGSELFVDGGLGDT